MNSTTAGDPQIGPVPSEEQAEALRLVFSRLDEGDRRHQLEMLRTATPGVEDPLAGLLGGYRHGRLVGAVFSQVLAGRTATIWPPRIVTDEPRPTAARLLAAACDALAGRQICMAQVLLPSHAPSDVAILHSEGFERLAKLLYLVSLEGEFPSQTPRGPLVFEPYAPSSHERLARLVEETYRQTLDCPRLNDVRRTEDVLAGYRATGTFDPRQWSIVRHEDRDVGCLLLADHPQDGNCELVYMGLAASERGHGWGTHVARQAQWQTRRAGRSRLVLAVDAANEPALRIYTAVGFRAFDRRSAYVKVFGPGR